MKAVIFKEHGDLDRLIYTDVPIPKIGPDELLVRVKACALNHLDIWTRQGMPGIDIPLPHILGCDVAGEVAEVGSDIRDLKSVSRVIVSPGITLGDSKWAQVGWDSLSDDYKILGFQVDGGYAEYVKVPARNVIAVSDRYSWEEWAACPLVFLTAWHMLVTRAEIKKGEAVLVQAAGSGVGSAAIQIAKHVGARVLTTVGNEEKAERAKQLGADEVINYKSCDLDQEVLQLTGGRGVDVVLDHVGGETFQKSLAALSKKGRMVTCGATSGPSVPIDLRFVFMRQHAILGCYMGGRKELDAVVKLLANGKLKPVVDTVFPLEEARQAQARMQERKNFGKIVLSVPC